MLVDSSDLHSSMPTNHRVAQRRSGFLCCYLIQETSRWRKLENVLRA